MEAKLKRNVTGMGKANGYNKWGKKQDVSVKRKVTCA